MWQYTDNCQSRLAIGIVSGNTAAAVRVVGRAYGARMVSVTGIWRASAGWANPCFTKVSPMISDLLMVTVPAARIDVAR